MSFGEVLGSALVFCLIVGLGYVVFASQTPTDFLWAWVAKTEEVTAAAWRVWKAFMAAAGMTFLWLAIPLIGGIMLYALIALLLLAGAPWWVDWDAFISLFGKEKNR